MARYTVEYNGKKYVVEGDANANEEDLRAAIENHTIPAEPLVEADIPGLEKAVKEYVTTGAKRGDLSVQGLQALGEKYNSPITNAQDVYDFYKKYGTVNPSLVVASPDIKKPELPAYSSEPELNIPLPALSVPAPAAPQKAADIVAQQPSAGGAGNLTRSFAKGALFNFNDEIEAAGRMLAEGRIDPAEYYRIKNQINTDYEAWAKANPKSALGGELAGGIATTFIPGVGFVAKGLQGVTRIGRIANVGARGAAVGAGSGALSGVGQAEDFGSVPAEALIGAGSGAVLGGLVPLGGKVVAAGMKGVDRLAGRPVLDAAQQRAATIIHDTLTRSGMSPERAAAATRLANKYGVPQVLGESSPEMTRLMETTAAKPSEGRELLVDTLVGRQANAPARTGQQLIKSFGNPEDYFKMEDDISGRLKSIGQTEYKKAYLHGTVDDPVLQNQIDTDPDLQKAFIDALEDTRRLKTQAKLDGIDPEQFNLAPIHDPILDAQGALIGSRITGVKADVRTLDEMKKALDRRIDSLYRSGQGGEATTLKNVRNSFVRRIDAAVPDYRIARSKYAGELEVREALRSGRTDFMKLRPQEVSSTFAGMSDAERDAFKNGALQNLLEPIQDAKQARNFANDVINKAATREKLRTILEPKEFAVLNAALSREAKNFKTTSKVLGGSRTVPLAQQTSTIDDMIAGGQAAEALTAILNPTPGMLARTAGKMLGFLRDNQFNDKVYTELATVLRSGSNMELARTIKMLQTYAREASRVAAINKQTTGRGAVLAGQQGAAVVAGPGYQKPPRITNAPAEKPVSLEDINRSYEQAQSVMGLENEPNTYAPAMDVLEPVGAQQ